MGKVIINLRHKEAKIRLVKSPSTIIITYNCFFALCIQRLELTFLNYVCSVLLSASVGATSCTILTVSLPYLPKFSALSLSTLRKRLFHCNILGKCRNSGALESKLYAKYVSGTGIYNSLIELSQSTLTTLFISNIKSIYA